jgi:inosine-uridine nucleoside N-ribohydrolase
MQPQKIIIDTDPGVDDALAIMLACTSPEIEILGICTVFGNTSTENATNNALTLMQIMDKNIPVFQGISKPVYGGFKPANSHGQNGLGNFKLDNLVRSKEDQNALDFYINILDRSEPKSISVLVIGPSTNLAVLKLLRPDLFEKIKEIVVMVGVFQEQGNTTKYAEFNSYCDPYSLQELLKSSVDTVLIPANVCRKVQFLIEDFLKIKNQNQKFLEEITSIYINYYQNNSEFGNFQGGVMYDLLTVAYILKPEIFEFKTGEVLVNTSQNQYFGQTTFSKNSKSNLKTAININENEVKELFFQTLNLYS